VFEDIVLVDANSNGFETPRVECSITIEGVDDGRLKFYETSTSLPSYTAGDKADVTVYRDIKANEWSTLVLPFNLSQANAKAVFGNDVQFAQFSGFEVDYGADESNVIPLSITIQLTSYSIPARIPLAGGTPILIKTNKDISEIKLDNVTLTEGVTVVEKADQYNTSGILTGSIAKTTVPADGLFINDNKFWYSTGNTQIKGFRCWFELGAVLNKATDFGAPVFFEIDGNVTGIKNIQKYTKDDDRYYNLSGQRVENPTKGLYIKNGKKVVVK
jgi:hypothetical protein